MNFGQPPLSLNIGYRVQGRAIEDIHGAAVAGEGGTGGYTLQLDPAPHSPRGRIDAGDALGLPYVAPEFTAHPLQLSRQQHAELRLVIKPRYQHRAIQLMSEIIVCSCQLPLLDHGPSVRTIHYYFR